MDKSYAVRMIEARYGQPFEDLLRERRDRGMSIRDIAEEFEVSHQTVWRAARRLEEATETVLASR